MVSEDSEVSQLLYQFCSPKSPLHSKIDYEHSFDVFLLFSAVAMAPQFEMAVGLKKGHKVTKVPQKPRPSRRRGVSNVSEEITIIRFNHGEPLFG